MDFLRLKADLQNYAAKDCFSDEEKRLISGFATMLVEEPISFEGAVKAANSKGKVFQKIWTDPNLQKEFKDILTRYSIKEEYFTK